jgi:hypothetical protein
MRIRGHSIALILTVFALLPVVSAAQTSKTPPKKTAPAKQLGQPKDSSEVAKPSDEQPDQRPLLENDKVRVFRYEIPARTTFTTAEHQAARIVVPTADLTMLNGPQRIVARTGEVQIAKAGPGERLVNNGTAPVVVVIVDLMQRFDPSAVFCGLQGARCESELGGDLKTGSWGINTLLKSMTLEIANVEIDPAVTTDEMKRRAPFLRIAVSHLKLAEQVGEAAPTVIEQAPGDATWVPTGDPVTLKNMGVTKANFAMISFPSM